MFLIRECMLYSDVVCTHAAFHFTLIGFGSSFRMLPSHARALDFGLPTIPGKWPVAEAGSTFLVSLAFNGRFGCHERAGTSPGCFFFTFSSSISRSARASSCAVRRSVSCSSSSTCNLLGVQDCEHARSCWHYHHPCAQRGMKIVGVHDRCR